MIIAETDEKGRRTYRLPLALVNVAEQVFPHTTSQQDSVFCLAARLSLSDIHTAENIAINLGHGEAVSFVTSRVNNAYRSC